MPCNARLQFRYHHAMIAAAILFLASLMVLYSGSSGGLRSVLHDMVSVIRDSYCVREWAPHRHFWHDMDAHPLPACTMETCFNRSRCDASDIKHLKIYVYKHEECHYRHAEHTELPYYFRALSESPWVTDDPESACLLLVLLPPKPSGEPHCPFRSLPHWNGGVNHVIASLSDTLPSDIIANPASIGMASMAASCLQLTSFRPGFDVSIPLPGLSHFRHLAPLPPRARKYFLTFKGKRYIGNKEGNFRSDPSFRSLNNLRDVIVVTSCNHTTNNRIRARCPHLNTGCDDDEAMFTKYRYEELMNSTFGLAPAGRSSSSYRIIEVMSAGAIPVIVADNYVEPLESGKLMIEWGRCALRFETIDIVSILPALRAMSEEELRSRQAYCVRVYEEYLKDDNALLGSVVRFLFLRLNFTNNNTTSKSS